MTADDKAVFAPNRASCVGVFDSIANTWSCVTLSGVTCAAGFTGTTVTFACPAHRSPDARHALHARAHGTAARPRLSSRLPLPSLAHALAERAAAPRAERARAREVVPTKGARAPPTRRDGSCAATPARPRMRRSARSTTLPPPRRFACVARSRVARREMAHAISCSVSAWSSLSRAASSVPWPLLSPSEHACSLSMLSSSLSAHATASRAQVVFLGWEGAANSSARFCQVCVPRQASFFVFDQLFCVWSRVA